MRAGKIPVLGAAGRRNRGGFTCGLAGGLDLEGACRIATAAGAGVRDGESTRPFVKTAGTLQ